MSYYILYIYYIYNPAKYHDVYTNTYSLNLYMLDRSRGSIRECIPYKEIAYYISKEKGLLYLYYPNLIKMFRIFMALIIWTFLSGSIKKFIGAILGISLFIIGALSGNFLVLGLGIFLIPL